MNNSNLEFRKIPSLQFLYEINENGTILRNVKSKKHIKIKLDMHHSLTGYYASFVNIKGKVKRVMIHKAVAECWLGPCPLGFEVDHIDRNSRNNDYRNLRYVNHSGQMKNRALSERIISNAQANCFEYTMGKIAKPVTITNIETNISLYFPSIIQCSKFLAKKYSKPIEHIRNKLKKRRSYIYDYNVRYSRNAQTGRVGSTEQGTVDDHSVSSRNDG